MVILLNIHLYNIQVFKVILTQVPIIFICLFIYLLFAVLGLELRAFPLNHSASLFCEVFFEIGSHALFAWAGFELQCS
jgi:hypothetical protein